MLQREQPRKKVPGSLSEGKVILTRKRRRLRVRLQGNSGGSLKTCVVRLYDSSRLNFLRTITFGGLLVG